MNDETRQALSVLLEADLTPEDWDDIETAIAEKQMDPDVGGGVDRDKIPAADFAGKNRSFPIVSPKDVADAAVSIGRAGADNYSSDELKGRIIAIAKRKGPAFVAQLPASWRGEPSEASAEAELAGDFVPLVEKAVRRDGTIAVKIIQPGMGSSGFYPPEVLERDGPRVFPAGTKMFADHATAAQEAERPEGSIKDLVAEFVSGARWDAANPAGPGLYADAKVFEHWRPFVEELAPHIGVSIRATGRAKPAEVEGKRVPVIEELTSARSVDFVTTPGAGGQILSLFESARSRAQSEITNGGDEDVEKLQEAEQARDAALAEVATLKQELETVKAANAALLTENARMKEGEILREAKAFVAETLPADLPDLTRARLVEALSLKPVLSEGALDRDAYRAVIEAAAKAEVEYLAKITESGVIKGMGLGAAEPDATESLEKTAAAFKALGLSESAAKIAAIGR